MPSSGCGSKPALRSAPLEKPRPAPVIITARTLGSAAGPLTMSRSPAPNSAIHALRVSGRLSVIRPTDPDCSHRTVSELVKAASRVDAWRWARYRRDAHSVYGRNDGEA